MGRPEVRTVLLFEDQAQETFLRRLVKSAGLRPERYQSCRNNVGVLQRLGLEVDALRERNFPELGRLDLPSLTAARAELGRIQ